MSSSRLVCQKPSLSIEGRVVDQKAKPFEKKISRESARFVKPILLTMQILM
jgi:hypothetical protein